MKKRRRKREEIVDVIVEVIKKEMPQRNNFTRIKQIVKRLALRSKSPLGRLVESIMFSYMIKHNGATPNIDTVISMLTYARPYLGEDPLLKEKVTSYYKNILKNLLKNKSNIDQARNFANFLEEKLKEYPDLKKLRRIEVLYMIMETIEKLTKESTEEEEWF
ncbi:MAG: hypothetical protein QW228_07790 [Candidatus Aenigmatarchaeota archaeon]